MLWIPFWAAGVVNGIGHALGYRNFQVKDESRNITPDRDLARRRRAPQQPPRGSQVGALRRHDGSSSTSAGSTSACCSSSGSPKSTTRAVASADETPRRNSRSRADALLQVGRAGRIRGRLFSDRSASRRGEYFPREPARVCYVDVKCRRCGQTRAGFERPPFPGAIGAAHRRRDLPGLLGPVDCASRRC